MRPIGTAVLLATLSLSAPAQPRGGMGQASGRMMGQAPGRISPGLVVRGTVPFRTFGSPTGFGNILFPGTGNQPPLIDPFSFPSTFAARVGASVSGFPGFSGAPLQTFRSGFRQPVVFPVAYPVYVGGYGGYQEGAYPPNVTIVMPQYPAQPASPVTINQTFVPESAKPSIQEYGPGKEAPSEQSNVRTYQAPSRAPAAAPADDRVLFFIALRDNSVYTAVAYWVEGETLHYITTQGKHNQVSLDLVDRDLSARLNEGRQIEFRLPPSKD